MTESQAFLKAILDSPDDAHLRLVYADWLEERGRGDLADLLRRPGRWVVQAAREKPRLKGGIALTWAHWLVWDDTGPGDVPPLCLGKLEGPPECQGWPAVDEAPPGHYGTASTRYAGRWLCWHCATAASKARVRAAESIGTLFELGGR